MKMLDEKFWEKYFKVYDVLNMVIPYQELMEELERELDSSAEDIVLDVGSGTGNLMMRIKNKAKKITGLDFSKTGIDSHKEKDPGADVLLFDITEKLPFSDDYFSKVVSNNTIYTLNFDQQRKVLFEIYRILKPGGKFVVSNVIKDFSPIKIYTDHVIKSIQKKGIIRTIASIFILLLPTIKMFYYNMMIKNSGATKNYNFFRKGEQKKVLENIGFKNVSEDKFVYSNQGIMNSCYKI
jgi:ubiquinone/menaquinone biosynthesis C-methylase UbiE